MAPGATQGRAAVAPTGDQFTLSDPRSGLSVQVRLEHVRSATPTFVRPDTLAVHSRVAFRLRSDGLEDFTLAPRSSPVSYRLVLGENVRGLRLVDGTLELVDAGGAPRLRACAPWVQDAGHARHRAQLTVEGCAVDTDPSAPWGRVPVRPGARECRVRVTWPSHVAAALVDPAWTTTGSMKVGRLGHATVLLDTGKVLAVGGSGTFANGVVTELWDPATETWATTGSTAQPSEGVRGAAAKLTDGRVLIVTSNDAELYDPVAGTWSTTTPPGTAFFEHTVTALPNGKALIAGGLTAGAELFDPASNGFSPTGDMTAVRRGHRAVLLPSGKVILMGAALDVGSPYKQTDFFDPATGTFTPGSEMVHGREHHAAALLDDGRVLVAGGCLCSGSNIPAEVYDPALDVWTKIGPVPGQDEIDNLALAPLPGGKALAAGGWNFGVKDQASVFGQDWAVATPMKEGRSGHSATALPDGSVLVVGGQTSQAAALSSVERFRLTALGAACTAAGDCATGYCVDGVCCDSACPTGAYGRCQACATAQGASADGTCTPLPPSTSCSASNCAVDTFVPAGTCDGAGTCVVPAAQSCAPFVCDDQGCKTACVTDADCLGQKTCQGGACKLKDGYTCTADPECASGHCDNGICCLNPPCGAVDGGPLPTCQVTQDCPTGWVCAIGKCYPPSSDADAGQGASGSSGGCGCRASKGDREGHVPAGILQCVLWVLVLRRAKARGGSPRAANR